MVEHEGLVRKLSDELDGDGQVLRKEQQVVGQIELPQLRDASTKLWPQHEAVIRFIVNDVADADELWVPGVFLQLSPQVGRAQVHPAHDALDQGVLVRKFQQPLGLFDHLACLHGDGAVELDRLEQRLEFIRQVIASQDGHGIGHPDLVGGIVFPEMLVGIEADHGWRWGSVLIGMLAEVSGLAPRKVKVVGSVASSCNQTTNDGLPFGSRTMP